MKIKATCHYCGRPIFEGSPAYTDFIFSYCSQKCKADYKASSEGGASSGGGGDVVHRAPAAPISREEKAAREEAETNALMAEIKGRYEAVNAELKKKTAEIQEQLDKGKAKKEEEVQKFVREGNKEHFLEYIDRYAKNSISHNKKYAGEINQLKEEAKSAIEKAWEEDQDETRLVSRIIRITDSFTHGVIKIGMINYRRKEKIFKILVATAFAVIIIVIVFKCAVG